MLRISVKPFAVADRMVRLTFEDNPGLTIGNQPWLRMANNQQSLFTHCTQPKGPDKSAWPSLVINFTHGSQNDPWVLEHWFLNSFCIWWQLVVSIKRTLVSKQKTTNHWRILVTNHYRQPLTTIRLNNHKLAKTTWWPPLSQPPPMLLWQPPKAATRTTKIATSSAIATLTNCRFISNTYKNNNHNVDTNSMQGLHAHEFCCWVKSVNAYVYMMHISRNIFSKWLRICIMNHVHFTGNYMQLWSGFNQKDLVHIRSLVL